MARDMCLTRPRYHPMCTPSNVSVSELPIASVSDSKFQFEFQFGSQDSFFSKQYVRRLVCGIFERVVSDNIPATTRKRRPFTRGDATIRKDILASLIHAEDAQEKYAELEDHWLFWQRSALRNRTQRIRACVHVGLGFAEVMARRRTARAFRRQLPRNKPRGYKAPVVSCELQSDVPRQVAARIVRDIILREKAKEKAEAERKKVPKQERLQAVKQRRDKRNPVEYQSGLRPSVIGSGLYGNGAKRQFAVKAFGSSLEMQSGALAGAAFAGVGLLCGSVLRLVRKASSAADESVGLMKTLRKELEGVGKRLKGQVGGALWCVPLIMTLFYCYHRLNSNGPFIPLVIAGVAAKVVGPKAWACCSEFFRSRTVELQSGLDSFVSAAPKLLASIFTFAALRGRKPFAVSEFCKRLASIDRMSLGWESFLGWFMKGLEVSVNFFRTTFGKEKIQLMREQHGALRSWQKEVDVVLEDTQTGGDVDPKKLSHMVDLVRRGFEFKNVYQGTTISRTVDDYLSKVAGALQPYEGALKAKNNFRVEPSMCMLYGAPGVGKTMMAMPLCCAVLKMSGIVPAEANFEQTISQIWQKGNSEYWNGYAGQECLVLDDCFQAKPDKTNMENDYMNIIRVVSSWSFPLNFADLASKGKIYFGSKFVFGTTNMSSVYNPAAEVIFEPEAVVRRMSHPYKIRVAKPYALDDGKLNFEAFKACERLAASTGEGIDRYPWHIWEVARHDFITGQTSDCYFPLKEVIERMAVELRKKFESHEDQKSGLKGFVEGFFGQQGAAEVELQSGAFQNAAFGFRSSFGVYAAHDVAKELAEHERLGKIISTTLRLFFSAAFWIAAIVVIKEAMKFVFGLISALFSVPGKIFKKKEKEKILQSNVPKRGPTRVGAKPSSVQLQGYDDTIATNAYSNSYKLYASLSAGGSIVLGQVLFIKDRLVVQPAHFTKDVRKLVEEGSLAEGQCLHFRHCVNAEYVFSVTPQKYLSLRRSTIQEAEVEFLSFSEVRAHRNITSNFIRESDYKFIGGHPTRLDVCNIERNGALSKAVKRKVFVSQNLFLGKKLAVAGSVVDRYMRYTADTEPGDCGAVLCAADPSRFSGRAIMGIHFAGTTDRLWGYSTVVTQEMIEKAVCAFDVVEDAFEEDLTSRGVVLQSSQVLPFDEQGSFLPLFTVDRPINICPKTSYFLTSEYGVIGPYEDRPAPLCPVLRDGVWVHPMCNAVKPYSSPVLIYEQPYLDQALHVAMRPLFDLIKNRDRHIYSFEESVLGIPQEKFRSIPRGTSAGYPYILDHKNGKKDFFGDGEKYDLDGERAVALRERVEHVIAMAKANVRSAVVYLDFLKDELRSPAKVEAVATRLISAAPVDYTIAWRSYFGAFSAAVMSASVQSGMAPGVNVYSEVGLMAAHLGLKGDQVFDGDFKAFDSSEQPSLHNKILDAINAWYDDGEENARVRSILWLDLVHSRHIGGSGYDQRHIYQWNKSLPSGHPFTTIVNSIYSLTLLVSAYIRCTGDWSGFWDHVSALTYGDDNVVNTTDKISEVYNQEQVSKALASDFGVVYTPGNKLGGFTRNTTLSDVTFLKRGFRLEEGRWLCPLDPNSFLFTAYWCKNSRLMRDIIADNWENALEELSMHDPRLWCEYAPTIVARLGVYAGGTKFLPQRAAYLAAVLRRTDDWY